MPQPDRVLKERALLRGCVSDDLAHHAMVAVAVPAPRCENESVVVGLGKEGVKGGGHGIPVLQHRAIGEAEQ